MNSLTRTLLFIGGTACVALGVLGMFLPLLPTTPFLLLAAVCYARSSRRFYRWLVTNRWCGHYIRNYRDGRGISRRHKVLSILLLWLTIGSTGLFVLSSFPVRLVLLCIALAVTIHIWRIPVFGTRSPAHDAGPTHLSTGGLTGVESDSPHQ
ncbi:YbaN family protein [Candidatus Fermentibacteria bacterium]|nr:YbaN family protein [Candidatus Fermentibacteria bacterium]